MKSTTPLSHFSLSKGRGGNGNPPSQQTVSHARLVLEVQLLAAYLRENDVMVRSGTFSSQSLDKNTILGLNTKFFFMNNITGSGSKCLYFFFLHSLFELLTH